MSNTNEFYHLGKRQGRYYCATISEKWVIEQIGKGHLNSEVMQVHLFIGNNNNDLLIAFFHDKPNKGKYSYIRTYRISKRGRRGYILTIPLEWIYVVEGKVKDLLQYIPVEEGLIIRKCLEKKGI